MRKKVMAKIVKFEKPLYLRILGWVYNNPNSILLDISKRMDITYSHLVKIKIELEIRKWIDTKKDGRTRRVNLTEQGKKIAEAFIYLEQVMEEKLND
jgi:DNA-binding MarR family transcriptional regulator